MIFQRFTRPGRALFLKILQGAAGLPQVIIDAEVLKMQFLDEVYQIWQCVKTLYPWWTSK